MASRLRILFVIFGFLLGITGCTEKKSESSDKKKAPEGKLTVHGSSSGQGKPISITEIIKQKTLPAFPSIPIGKAFDGYAHFKKKEWRESELNGKYYVDFIGVADSNLADVMKTDITNQAIIFKFVVLNDGSFGLAMVSREDLMKDGTRKTFVMSDTKTLLEKIYGNQEIKF